MIVHLNILPNSVGLRIPIHEDRVRGCIAHELEPGDIYHGYSYDELRNLGEGKHKLEERYDSNWDDDNS